MAERRARALRRRSTRCCAPSSSTAAPSRGYFVEAPGPAEFGTPGRRPAAQPRVAATGCPDLLRWSSARPTAAEVAGARRVPRPWPTAPVDSRRATWWAHRREERHVASGRRAAARRAGGAASTGRWCSTRAGRRPSRSSAGTSTRSRRRPPALSGAVADGGASAGMTVRRPTARPVHESDAAGRRRSIRRLRRDSRGGLPACTLALFTPSGRRRGGCAARTGPRGGGGGRWFRPRPGSPSSRSGAPRARRAAPAPVRSPVGQAPSGGDGWISLVPPTSPRCPRGSDSRCPRSRAHDQLAGGRRRSRGLPTGRHRRRRRDGRPVGPCGPAPTNDTLGAAAHPAGRRWTSENRRLRRRTAVQAGRAAPGPACRPARGRRTGRWSRCPSAGEALLSTPPPAGPARALGASDRPAGAPRMVPGVQEKNRPQASWRRAAPSSARPDRDRRDSRRTPVGVVVEATGMRRRLRRRGRRRPRRDRRRRGHAPSRSVLGHAPAADRASTASATSSREGRGRARPQGGGDGAVQRGVGAERWPMVAEGRRRIETPDRCPPRSRRPVRRTRAVCAAGTTGPLSAGGVQPAGEQPGERRHHHVAEQQHDDDRRQRAAAAPAATTPGAASRTAADSDVIAKTAAIVSSVIRQRGPGWRRAGEEALEAGDPLVALVVHHASTWASADRRSDERSQAASDSSSSNR